MNKKLTLSVDDFVINRAKEYAREQNKSLSEIVENYFRSITSSDIVHNETISPLVRELMGSIKVPEDFDYEKEKLEYLEKKYLHD